MGRAVFYITLLVGLLATAFFLPKMVQNHDELKPVSEKATTDAGATPDPAKTAAAPAGEPSSSEASALPTPDATPAPAAVVESAPDLSPFVAAVASGDLPKAAAILDLLKSKMDAAKYADLHQSIETARSREAAKSPAPAPKETSDPNVATQGMVVESLKQLQKSQAETSKLLAELKARPSAPEPASTAAAPSLPSATGPLPDTVTIHFGLDSSLMEQAETEKLSPVLKALAAETAVKVELRGYADKKGNSVYNLGLSNARAQSVKDYLRRAGIEDARMHLIPFGSSQSGNADPKDAEDLRKVEVVVIR